MRMLPFSVNFTALPTRLTITCRSRAPSVWMVSGNGPK